MKIKFISLGLLLISASCQNGKVADAYGNFEADEWIISAEVNGIVTNYLPEEGIELNKGVEAAVIDSMQLYLKKQQVQASIEALRKKLPERAVQIAVYDEQLQSLNREVKRITALVENKAAPAKQLDDIKSQYDLVKKQKDAAISGIDIQTRGLLAEIEPLHYQLLQLNDQLTKCRVINPEDGLVLATYIKKDELAQAGKPLYRIARQNPLILRAYFAGNQLQEIKSGQQVKVLTDLSDGKMKEQTGTISWISSEAEFTPKTVQTREERVTQVYAVKIKVPNDGSLKIGMPAEVYLK